MVSSKKNNSTKPGKATKSKHIGRNIIIIIILSAIGGTIWLLMPAPTSASPPPPPPPPPPPSCCDDLPCPSPTICNKDTCECIEAGEQALGETCKIDNDCHSLHCVGPPGRMLCQCKKGTGVNGVDGVDGGKPTLV